MLSSINPTATAAASAIKHVLVADVSRVAFHKSATPEKRRDARALLSAWNAMRSAHHPAHFRGAIVALRKAQDVLRQKYGVEVDDLHIERHTLREWRLPQLGGIVVRSVVYAHDDGSLLVLDREVAMALALECQLDQAEEKRNAQAARAAWPKRTRKAAQATA
jgi:hypothetical protein